MPDDRSGRRPPRPAPWYERAFGPLYPLVYAHRDDAEAERAVRLLLPSLPGGPVLDLACGTGRHLRALGRSGALAVGLDASPDLLRLAREKEPAARLVRGDMRDLPFRGGRFSAVLSLFTSFGYFESEAEDRLVLAGVARVLVGGGVFVLDLPNPAEARAGAGRRSERESGGYRVEEDRFLSSDGRRLEKRVRVLRGAAGADAVVDEYTESLRLYERSEIEGILGEHGFRLERAWGDYDGNPPSERSPRVLLLFRRKPGAERAAGKRE